MKNEVVTSQKLSNNSMSVVTYATSKEVVSYHSHLCTEGVKKFHNKLGGHPTFLTRYFMNKLFISVTFESPIINTSLSAISHG